MEPRTGAPCKVTQHAFKLKIKKDEWEDSSHLKKSCRTIWNRNRSYTENNTQWTAPQSSLFLHPMWNSSANKEVQNKRWNKNSKSAHHVRKRRVSRMSLRMVHREVLVQYVYKFKVDICTGSSLNNKHKCLNTLFLLTVNLPIIQLTECKGMIKIQI